PRPAVPQAPPVVPVVAPVWRAQPIIVTGPGPLPTTRRSRKVIAQELDVAAQAGAAPSIDALINGDVERPQRFQATPSWAELQPPTPASPVGLVAGPGHAVGD